MQKEYTKALHYSFLLLKYRQRSTCEIKTRLRQKKFSQSVVEEVTRYLLDNRYVDDRDFAFLYARQKFRDAFGERKVVFELKKFGIDHPTIQEAIQAASREYKMEDTIKVLIKKKCRNKTKGATIRYLAGRGFSYDVILQGVNDED